MQTYRACPFHLHLHLPGTPITRQIVNDFVARALDKTLRDKIPPVNAVPVVPSDAMPAFPACWNDAGRPTGHLHATFGTDIPAASVVAKAAAQAGSATNAGSSGSSSSYSQADINGTSLPFRAFVMLDSDGAEAVQISPSALQPGVKRN